MLYKLKNRLGETLVETLVSLLIVSLSMLMFSGMIAATARITTKGRTWNADVNQEDTSLEKRNDETDKTGTITISSESAEGEVSQSICEANVKFYVTNYGGKDVISYEAD